MVAAICALLFSSQDKIAPIPANTTTAKNVAVNASALIQIQITLP
jgi:hypothetical protein